MNYFRPQKLSQALSWLADNEAGIAAGCTDLFAATQSQYLQKHDHANLLDVTAIDELKTITTDDDGIKIGAGVSWSEIIAADLPAAFDGLKAAANEIGSVQIQNSATIGGNLCNASPAADGVPPLVTLDAKIELASPSGNRILPILDFLLGPGQSAIKHNEILTHIHLPSESTRGCSSFRKLGARKYLVISIAMVAGRLVVENEQVKDIALCVGSCSATAVRLSAIEAEITGQLVETLLAGNALDDLVSADRLANYLSPIDDIRADAQYRIIAASKMVSGVLRDLMMEGIAS